jgi:hypothetical protein
MPRMAFEPTIPAFERAKTVHALDSAATVTGYGIHWLTTLGAFMAIEHVARQFID